MSMTPVGKHDPEFGIKGQDKESVSRGEARGSHEVSPDGWPGPDQESKVKLRLGPSLVSQVLPLRNWRLGLEFTQYISNQFLSCVWREGEDHVLSLENKDILSVEYLLPSPLCKSRGRVAPRTLLIAEECAGSQTRGPSLPTLDPASIFQRSGRGHEGGMGTQAESSFPWRIAGMTSCKVRTSLADLFSQGKVVSSWADSSAKGVYGVLAASSASHNLRWSHSLTYLPVKLSLLSPLNF